MPSTPTQRCRTFAVLVTLGGLAACGPSVQVLHEGTVRFEHCHRLDLDPQIAPSHRLACWQAWTTRYSYGQPRDRLEYAQRRIAAIQRNEPPPQLEIETTPQHLLEEPEGPTDVHAPPPPIARPANGAQPSDDDSWRTAAEAPGDQCARDCRQERARCLDSCSEGGPETCPCETNYRGCMVRCFE